MAANIYKITFDTEHYRTLKCIDSVPENHFLINARSREEDWKTVNLAWENEDKPEADFSLLPPNAFVVKESIKEILLKKFYFHAEYLPVNVGANNYYIINFRNCAPALNLEKSKLVRNKDTNEIISIKKYSLLVNRLTPGTVFKIVEMKGLETFCYQYCLDIDREFIFGYEQRYKWSGLLFERVFSFARPQLR